MRQKWWIWVFLLAFAALIFWGTRPSRAITVVTHGGLQVYDVQYFPDTNRIYYWRCLRCAWRDAQSLWHSRAKYSQHGPALVVYCSRPVAPQQPLYAMLLQSDGRFAANNSQCDDFGNRLVTKFFFDHGPMTNGVYQLMFDLTNVVADITVNLKN